MQSAEVVLGVLRERGRKGLPCMQLYRQMFNKDLYLLAYGNIYSNSGAMTPGAGGETADGMSEDKIDQIIEAMRREKYRFAPARRIYIPKKNGKLRPLGLPSWSGKLVGEVVRLLWRRTMNRSSQTIPTGSAKAADATQHCGRSAKSGARPRGSSRVTSPTAS